MNENNNFELDEQVILTKGNDANLPDDENDRMVDAYNTDEADEAIEQRDENDFYVNEDPTKMVFKSVAGKIFTISVADPMTVPYDTIENISNEIIKNINMLIDSINMVTFHSAELPEDYVERGYATNIDVLSAYNLDIDYRDIIDPTLRFITSCIDVMQLSYLQLMKYDVNKYESISNLNMLNGLFSQLTGTTNVNANNTDIDAMINTFAHDCDCDECNCDDCSDHCNCNNDEHNCQCNCEHCTCHEDATEIEQTE